MRTTPDENRRCARWIAAKLNRAEAPFCVLIPEHGVSALDARRAARSTTPRPTPPCSTSWNRGVEPGPRPASPPPAASYQRPRIRPGPGRRVLESEPSPEKSCRFACILTPPRERPSQDEVHT